MQGIRGNYGYGLSGLGRLWAPKRQRLVVGRDVAPIQRNETPKKEISPIILPGADDQLQAARQSYAAAAGQTRLGFSLREDISVSAASGGEAGGSSRQEQLLGQSASESVYLVSNGGQTVLRIVNADGEERLLNLTGKEDIRVGWSEDGRAEVFTGEAALTGGKLVAQGENDILVRLSAAEVEAGEGSTVLNLAGESGGKFSGGHNVRYLGAYQDADIESGGGESFFEGYFGSCRISAEKGKNTFSGVFDGLGADSFIRTGAEQDVFSGYFKLMNVTDAGGKNVFSGAFLTGSSILAGSGDDTFGGQFFDSRIKDQGGDNTFGSRLDLTGRLQLNFARTVIESGGGADTFFGAAAQSEVKLGGGADEASGILLNGTLDAGESDDRVRLLYSSGSVVDMGQGNDDLHLITGAANAVSLGAGDDKMSSGLNAGHSGGGRGALGAYAGSAFLTAGQARDGWEAKYGHYFGDVQSTSIDASEGEDEISVHDGLNAHSVKSGENSSGDVPAASGAAAGDQAQNGGGLLDARSSGDLALRDKLLETMRRVLKSGEGGAFSWDLADKMETAVRALEEKKSDRAKRPASAQDRFLNIGLGGRLPDPEGQSVIIDGGHGESVSFDRMRRNLFENISSGGAVSGGSRLRLALAGYDRAGGVNSYSILHLK